MLRIRFTPEDLVRVRVSEVVDPMWEVVCSVQVLQLGATRDTLTYAPWLQRSRGRLKDPTTRAAARVMATVAPQSTYFPDFLTPDRLSEGLEADLDRVLSTPNDRLTRETSLLPAQPPWVEAVGSGDPRSLTNFGNAVRHYHNAMIGPDRAQIEGVLATHRAELWRRLMHGGTESMLDSLGSTIRWRAPYLEANYPTDRTIDLAGRGLLLIPSYFCQRLPITLVDAGLAPVLVYPVDHPEITAAETDGYGLADLLGVTRAAVLEALAEEASTTEVARKVGISVATASHHTTVLRGAGLITSTRLSNRMVHSLSTLGSVFVTATDSR